MGEHKVFTLSQVAQHKTNKDCWFVVDGRVLDVTKFLDEHPGGEEVLIEVAGKDATKEFEAIGHSKAAKNMLIKYQVGVLQGFKLQDGGDATTYKESKSAGKELSAKVLKEDSLAGFDSVINFVVPFLVAVSVFGYRYLTREHLPAN